MENPKADGRLPCGWSSPTRNERARSLQSAGDLRHALTARLVLKRMEKDRAPVALQYEPTKRWRHEHMLPKNASAEKIRRGASSARCRIGSDRVFQCLRGVVVHASSKSREDPMASIPCGLAYWCYKGLATICLNRMSKKRSEGWASTMATVSAPRPVPATATTSSPSGSRPPSQASATISAATFTP
jgi:hypothetical protein